MRGLNAGKHELSRAELDGLIEFAKQQGAGGLVWGYVEDGGWKAPIAKFLSDDETGAIISQLGGSVGDLLLAVADKPESMEVCFVPPGDTAGFVERHAGGTALRPGALRDLDGTVLGTHTGVHRFTVGQRRGLGLAGGARRYVRAIDAATATVTVGGAEALAAAGLVARDVCWSAGTPPPCGAALAARIRHRHRPVPARLLTSDAGSVQLRFDAPGPAVTPGQAAVFYRDELVVGGGWIAGELPT